jgi:PAS domain S-box-containing protein
MVTNAKSNPVPVDRYRALFENSANAIMIIENQVCLDCNQAAVTLLGFEDKQSLLQCHPADLSPEYQSDGKRSFEKANQIMADLVHGTSRSTIFEWDHLKADGSIGVGEVSMTLIPSTEDSSPPLEPSETDRYTLHLIWRDISDRKRLEKELQHSQKMEALDNLVGGIAHDFNNVLVPIVTYADLLSSSLQDQPKLMNWAHEIARRYVSGQHGQEAVSGQPT